MKMKKLASLGLVLLGSLTIGGAAGAATTAYYIEYMDNMKPGVVSVVDAALNKNFTEQDSSLYHGTISIAYSEMDQVQKDANAYATQQVNQYISWKGQKNANEIKKHGDEILAEIKAHIDQELKDKTNGLYSPGPGKG